MIYKLNNQVANIAGGKGHVITINEVDKSYTIEYVEDFKEEGWSEGEDDDFLLPRHLIKGFVAASNIEGGG